MNDKAPTSQTPSSAPAAVQDTSALPGTEVAAEHDTTLKWIVTGSLDEAPTPPPKLESKRDRTSPALPLPAKGALAPAPKDTPRPESRSNEKADLEEPVAPAWVSPAPATPPPTVLAGPATPPPELPPQNKPLPPSNHGPAAAATALDTSGAKTPAAHDEPKGATPAEFVVPDSTPKTSRSDLAEVRGAAPVAILPGPTGSDSELGADAVEILPSAGDDVGALPTQMAASEAIDTPREGVEPRTIQPAHPASAEPHEVEPDAVEMMESAEHATAHEPAPPPKKPRSSTPPPVAKPRTLTPPPVPVEPATPTPPPVAKPRTLTPPPVPVEPATPAPPPVPPEVAAARPAQPDRIPEFAAALFEEFQTPAASGDQLPEALARRSLQKRSKPWYEEVFDEDYLRTLPFMTPEQTGREATFIRQVLAPPKGGEVLDVACGYGRHALELAQQGLRVTGLDLSLPLLIRAADDAQRRGLAVNFVHADMREMSFNGQFDAAYCVLSSFGYFDEETNLRVATAVCRALKPGGRFLLDIINRDYIVRDLPSRVWWEGDGCVVLEEVDFNYHTSRVLVRRSVAFGNGRQSEQEISMRAYSLHEVGKMLRQAGLRVLQVSGGLASKARFFGAASRNIIAVCERPAT